MYIYILINIGKVMFSQLLGYYNTQIDISSIEKLCSNLYIYMFNWVDV